MNDAPWPLRVMTRMLDRLGHPLAGMVIVALLGYMFVVLVLLGVVHTELEGEGVSKGDRAPWLIMLGLPWILAAAGFLAWSMWRTKRGPRNGRLRAATWVTLALVVAGLAMEISAVSWGIQAGRTCDYTGDALRACEQAATAAAQGPSILHAIAFPVLLVAVPLAPVLAMHRIQLRGIARNAGTPEASHAHSYLVVRLGAAYLLAAGLFSLLLYFIEFIVSQEVASDRGYDFNWMLEAYNPPAGEVVVELIWTPLAFLGLPLGVVLAVQGALMRLARVQHLDAGSRGRFDDLIGRDVLSGALAGERTGVWIALGFLVAVLLLVAAPAVSVTVLANCDDCGGFVHTLWPMLAILNVAIVTACSVLLAATLALGGRTLRGRRLREAVLAPSQRLESLYAGGSVTRNQFEELRSLARAFARGKPPGEPYQTAGGFLSILLPCWVIALAIWLFIASSVASDLEESGPHLTAFQVEVAILIVPAAILIVILTVTGWTMSALGKQETRESFLEFQQSVEHLLHEAHDRTVSSGHR